MDARAARKAPAPFSLARGLAPKDPFHSAARAGHPSASLTCSSFKLHSPLCPLPWRGGRGGQKLQANKNNPPNPPPELTPILGHFFRLLSSFSSLDVQLPLNNEELVERENYVPRGCRSRLLCLTLVPLSFVVHLFFSFS